MLVPGQEFIEIKVGTRHVKYFRKKGYDCKRFGVIRVKIEDLPENSSYTVEVYCDYCLKRGVKTIKRITYSKYLKTIKNNEKFCCNKCKDIKRKETCMRKYGVENYSQTKEFKEKYKQICLERYGVENAFQAEECKEKIKQTCLEKYGYENAFKAEECKERYRQTCFERYGVTHYSQTEEYKKKMEKTCFERYGVKSYSQTEECREKMEKTCFERYGVKSYSQTEDFKERVRQTCLEKHGVRYLWEIEEIKRNYVIKANETMYKNGTAPTSRQQNYICNLLNGELNYPVDRIRLDIAFPDERLYLEYDGGAHSFSVLCGYVSQEKFDHDELKREYFLRNRGWKMIRIVSSNDFIPQDDCLLQLIDDAKNYLQKGHTWYIIDIDNSEIRCAEYTKKINPMDLRKITEQVLIEQKNNLINNNKN